MKMLPALFFSGLLVMTTTAFADYCFLSDECDGEQICTDFVECAAPQYVSLLACEGDDDCSELRTCSDGLCKPTGVYCESNTGVGIVTAYESLFECRDDTVGGSVHGGEWDWLCEPGGENERNCDLAEVHEMPELTLDSLYENCRRQLASLCGKKDLDPEEECTEEALAVCTEWVLFDTQLSAACTEDKDAKDSRSAEIVASPSWVVHCCRYEFKEDREGIESYLSCVSELSPSDCEAVDDCVTDVYGEERSSASDGMSGSSDSRDEGDDKVGANDSAQNSGCAVEQPGRAVHSLLQLLP
ncbi:MAG: hypothetical protein JXR76_21765 [Deltaproteobacteria bacterium]|nr:hypothetical protein [Deltaproteobacteria bacterium]